MGAFENYPYTNFQSLNLNYILKKLASLESGVNEVIKLSKTWSSQVDALNTRMAKIENENAQILELYNSFKAEIEADFEELANKQIEDFNLLVASIDNRFNNLERNINIILSSMDDRIDYIDAKLDQTLDNLPSLIMMTNPFTGQLDNLVNIIDDIASSQRVNGLEAQEYDALDLSAQAYDNYDITAYEYDWNGKNLLQ